MTPLEYIQNLEFENKGVMPTSLANGEDYVELLVEEVKGILPKEIQDLLLNGKLISKSISFDGIIALTKPFIETSNNCYAVVLSNGLRRIVYAIARVAYQVMYTSQQYFDETFESGCNQLIKLFYMLLRVEIPLAAHTRSDTLPPHIILEASYAALAAEKFFLLHEYAHVWLYESQSHDDLSPHEREYYCDAFSSTLLIDNLPPPLIIAGMSIEQQKLANLRTIYSGIFIALSLYDIAGELGVALSDSHPTGLERQKMFRRNVRQHFGDEYLVKIRKQSLVIENFLNEVKERTELLNNNGTLLDAIFKQQMDDLVSYLKGGCK